MPGLFPVVCLSAAGPHGNDIFSAPLRVPLLTCPLQSQHLYSFGLYILMAKEHIFNASFQAPEFFEFSGFGFSYYSKCSYVSHRPSQKPLLRKF